MGGEIVSAEIEMIEYWQIVGKRHVRDRGSVRMHLWRHSEPKASAGPPGDVSGVVRSQCDETKICKIRPGR